MSWATGKFLLHFLEVLQDADSFSLGEYAALCISGVISMEETLRIVASRATMMAEHCAADTSGMLACNLSAEMAEQVISEKPALAGLTVACRNSISDCVVGGPLARINLLHQDKNVRTKLLDVPYAFHTSAMDPVLDLLEELGSSNGLRFPFCRRYTSGSSRQVIFAATTLPFTPDNQYVSQMVYNISNPSKSSTLLCLSS